ncbi:hypothetical protein [uncultured Croceitalea sp.]|uniref:hypothetical protein n=1 Tax=uncultured Croceitalea sp. TaxID=1798908 RepID=UPI003305D868
MKQILITLVLLTLLSSTYLRSQENAPFLTGKVIVSISEGTFECDLTLSEIPQIEDYFIRLNSGMNLLHMRSKDPEDFLIYYRKSRNDSLSTGESTAYYFRDTDKKGKFLPKTIQFKYVGKFPVVKDTIVNYARKDWKGNIAFNQNAVRSDGRQSAWYPILYDIKNDKVFERVKYNIEVTCTDCSTLYVNGNKPIKAKSHNFKSMYAQELVLFCGNYDFKKLDNTYFLNSGFNQNEVKEFGKLINSYKQYYARNLKITFDESVSFIQTTPISKKDGWMFVSYPTIVSIGWQNGLRSILEPEYQNFYRSFIAHELGHLYFGTLKMFNSELGDMMSEGFAEFLSLNLTRNLISEKTYRELIDKKIKNLENFNAIPFAKIKSHSEYNNRQLYVYDYAPLIFLSMESEIGEKKMWNWLNIILTVDTRFTNYDFLTSTLKQAINNDKKYNTLKTKYFETEKSFENVIKVLKSKQKKKNKNGDG